MTQNIDGSKNKLRIRTTEAVKLFKKQFPSKKSGFREYDFVKGKISVSFFTDFYQKGTSHLSK